MSCPFYQHVTFMATGGLVASVPNPTSNACGMRIGAHAPCYMQLAGDQPNWATCTIRAWMLGVLEKRP